MQKIFALAFKDLKLLLRDKAGFFFTFFFPLLIAILFGAIFSGGGDEENLMSILVVDEDNTEQSRAFVATLQGAPELSLKTSSREEASKLVRQGKSAAYIVLTKGFGKAREHIFWGDPPRIEVGIDPSRRAEAGMLQGILMKYAVKDFQTAFTDTTKMHNQVTTALEELKNDKEMPQEQHDDLTRFLGELDRFMVSKPMQQSGTGEGFQGIQPLVFEEVSEKFEWKGPHNSYEISFPQGIVWGIIGCAASFGISLVTERRAGTLIRLRTAPLNRTQILAGKAVACFITTVAITVLLFAIAVLFFKVRPNSLALLAMGVISIAICFVGIMMLLSVLGKTERSAAGIGWAILLTMSMLGGGAVPLFIMPSWMKTLSHISPVKWAILSMEGAIWRNFSLEEMLLPSVILVSVGIIFFLIGIRAFRWTEQG